MTDDPWDNTKYSDQQVSRGEAPWLLGCSDEFDDPPPDRQRRLFWLFNQPEEPMKTIRVNGKKTARLHQPEVRSLDDASVVLKSIALRCDDPTEAEQCVLLAKGVDEMVKQYAPPAKEEQAEKKAKK